MTCNEDVLTDQLHWLTAAAEVDLADLTENTDQDKPPHNTESIKWIKSPVSSLEKADHVCWWCNIWRHGIVIYREDEVVTVIGWKFLSTGAKKYRPKIVEDKVNFHSIKPIYKATYKKECYEAMEVIDRARKHLGDTDYHRVTNKAAAFPRYCKTGYGGKMFVQPHWRAPVWVKMKIQDIKRGSHICYWNYLYYKHAIVCHPWSENNSQDRNRGHVIIISWKLTPPAKIIQEPIEFQKDSQVYVAVYSKVVCKHPDTVVERAMRRLGETKYNVVKNYARAFPRWCVTEYGGVFT